MCHVAGAKACAASLPPRGAGGGGSIDAGDGEHGLRRGALDPRRVRGSAAEAHGAHLGDGNGGIALARRKAAARQGRRRGLGARGASATCTRRLGGAHGCGARATSAGLRVTCVEALASAALSSDCILALRSRAVSPPNTAATTCLPSRRTEETRLKPEARV